MTKKEKSFWKKWRKSVALFVVLVVLGLGYVFREAIFWKKYENVEFEFSFEYPASWNITPDIVKKANFDSKSSDLFLFNIDANKGSLADEALKVKFPGDVQVSIFKIPSEKIRLMNRPTDGCVQQAVIIRCVSRSDRALRLYVEGEKYAFEMISVKDSSLGSILSSEYYFWIDSKILDSFRLTNN